MTPGESVYGEKRISIATMNNEGEEEKVEYRVWNPFRSKLAAGILGGLDDIHVSLFVRFTLSFRHPLSIVHRYIIHGQPFIPTAARRTISTNHSQMKRKTTEFGSKDDANNTHNRSNQDRKFST